MYAALSYVYYSVYYYVRILPSIYVSAYYYIRTHVLIPVYTTMSAYYYIRLHVLMLLQCRYMRRCVLILLYMCPHTTIYVSSYNSICPQLILLNSSSRHHDASTTPAIYVSTYHFIRIYICPRIKTIFRIFQFAPSRRIYDTFGAAL